ncbi:hypothetical protein RJT34_11673 [Clitoria ternatea]|uniref:Uncharacterized protein n=1 Tax=Clitoria ternatea TaxID=43366 RepID=A0AAN9JKI2_CLITE
MAPPSFLLRRLYSLPQHLFTCSGSRSLLDDDGDNVYDDVDVCIAKERESIGLLWRKKGSVCYIKENNVKFGSFLFTLEHDSEWVPASIPHDWSSRRYIP